MERYDEYKDSGVEWIGEIPAGWEVARIGQVASLSRQFDSHDDRYVGLENIESWTGRYVESDSSCDTSQAVAFARGDVLFGKLRPYLAKVFEASFSGLCSSELLPLTPRRVDGAYLSFCLRSPRFIDVVNESTYGTKMPRANWQYIRKLQIPLPPRNVQAAIASFLRSRTYEIDGVIADCEREVELLQEYRKAVISEAVTRGLDPNVPMKDSGIEWIGEIPVGWIVRPAKSLFTESKALRLSGDERCTVSQKYGVIPQSQFTALENQRTVLADKNLESWKHVSPGDFVISLRSFQGGIEFCRVSGCVTWHYIVLKGRTDADDGYFRYLFKSKGYIEALQRTCTYIRDGQDLRYSNFIQVSLPLPPLSEQRSIATYLDKKTAVIDALIADYQAMADKLREYRKSLISEAVTGKFKVPVLA